MEIKDVEISGLPLEVVFQRFPARNGTLENSVAIVISTVSSLLSRRVTQSVNVKTRSILGNRCHGNGHQAVFFPGNGQHLSKSTSRSGRP